VRAQHPRARVLCAEAVAHDLRPELPRGAQLRDLHVKVHAHAEKKREALRDVVHGEPRALRAAHVLDAVGEREGELDVCVRARLLHVVARDADAVKLGHVRRRVAKDVGDDAQARRDGVDERVAHHELLEHVVLDRARELCRGHALLLRGDDEEGHHGQHGAVHGHGHAHLVERDARKEDLHVLDGRHGHARHADVALDALIVAVKAAVRREVEGDAEPLLPRREVLAVKGVGLARRREARVLADRPRLVRVARRADAARKGKHAGELVERERRDVLARVDGEDREALGRRPRERRGRGAAALHVRRGGGGPRGGGRKGRSGA
jgi:hypothetical protein